MTRIFMTGAAGTVGKAVAPYLRGDDLVLTDRVADIGVQALPLADPVVVADAMRGCDVVVHGVGIMYDKPEAEIQAAMVEPLDVVIRAMRLARVPKLVLLSSAHVVGNYPLDVAVAPSSPIRPDGFYGWMHYVREQMVQACGLSATIVRIGVLIDQPRGDRRDRAIWISPRDTAVTIQFAIDVASDPAPILWGVSEMNLSHRWIHAEGRAPVFDNAADYPLTKDDQWTKIGGVLAI